MTNAPHKCDCLNYCGDDPWLANGKAEHCDNYKAAVKAEAMIESIHWKLPSDQMPDVGHLVIGFKADMMKRVNECYFDGAVWRLQDDHTIWMEGPTAWAHLPHGPVNTPWMKVR